MLATVRKFVKVRWYTDTDLDALVKAHSLCFPEENWMRRDFVRFADRPGQLVKVISSSVTGNVIGSLLLRNLLGSDAVIARLCVLPEYRRLGIATTALSSLVNDYKFNHRSSYLAKVGEHNVAAQMLLKKCGFKWFTTEHDVFGRDEDVYWFRFIRYGPTERIQRVFYPQDTGYNSVKAA
jgi:ribosomal protein S18 acetylase RimI-like enzyme